MQRDDYLLETLVDLGFITQVEVKASQSQARLENVGVVDYLVSKKIILTAQVLQAKAAHFGANVTILKDLQIPADAIKAVPAHLARKYSIVPIENSGHSISLALTDPTNFDTIDSLRHLLGKEITIQLASEEDIAVALDKYYPPGETHITSTRG